MPIAPILVGLLLVVGTIALALSGTTWRWYHITMASLIMLLSVVWFYLAARALKIEDAWRSEVAKWEKKDADADKEHDQILAGNYTDGEGKLHPLPLDQLKTEVAKWLQSRGRMWTNVARKAVTPDGRLTVTIDKPEPPGIDKNTILQVFDDTPLGSEGQFLGAFEVVDVKGKDVQLAPVLKLRPAELQRIAQPSKAPLVMYDIMPADRHDFLRIARDAVREMAPADKKEQVDQMDDATLAARLFPAGVLDEVKQEYAKDGKPPAAGETHPERIWRQVKVVKEIAVPMTDEEVKQAQAAGETPEVDPNTKQAIKKIPEGTVLLLDPKTAQERIAAGQVEPVAENDKIYVRPLRDYARLYRELNLQVEEILRATAELDRQNAAVVLAKQNADHDITERIEEIAKLTRDQGHLTQDNTLIKNHVAALEKEVAKVRGEVQNLLALNRQLEAEVVMQAHQAADIINRRAPPADSLAP
jgi:hypothetical protein